MSEKPFQFSSSSSRSQSSEKICAICLGSLRSGQGIAIFTAECSHSFHFNCIATNVQHGNRICPICRSEWKDIPFQAPAINNNVGRARTSSRRNTALETLHAARLLASFLLPLQLQPEPEHFADDEPLVNEPNYNPASPVRTQTQPLTIKAFPELTAVSATDCPPNFSVLLRICAPPFLSDVNHRAPIDLVTVLDVSYSMASKLCLLKLAVCFIIQNLGPADRLSIVVFSSSARRIFPLRRMTDSGREDASRAINSLFCTRGTNIVDGLHKGFQVLEERRECNPIASIILLSDGQDTYNVTMYSLGLSVHNQHLAYLNLLPASIRSSRGDSQQPTIPVHTFGFGLDHDSIAMHAIADASGGTFSFIESTEILQDAFARCIGGLLSVVAQCVRLTIRTVSPDVRIGLIPSGRYNNEIFDHGRQAVIHIGNLYADEEKEFLVYLSIPVFSAVEGDERSETTSLLDVMCTHKDSGSMQNVQTKGERVEIRRPNVLVPIERMISLEVDRQINRLLVAETIAVAQASAETGDLEGAQALLEKRRSILLSSASSQAGDGLCICLESELRDIKDKMASMELYEHTGRASALSGMSSHAWQRATTRGSSTPEPLVMSRDGSTSGSGTGYETPSMIRMVSRSQEFTAAAHGEQSGGVHKSGSLIKKR